MFHTQDLTSRKQFTYAPPELTRSMLLGKWCSTLDGAKGSESGPPPPRYAEGTRVSLHRSAELPHGRRLPEGEKGTVVRLADGGAGVDVAFDNGVDVKGLVPDRDVVRVAAPPRALLPTNLLLPSLLAP